MWIVYAIGSSFFAGITAILAKCGIRRTDSDVATAIRTIVVLLFSWLMVLSTGTIWGIVNIDGKDSAVFGTVRTCNRSVLDVLLSSTSKGRHQQSCSH